MMRFEKRKDNRTLRQGQSEHCLFRIILRLELRAGVDYRTAVVPALLINYTKLSRKGYNFGTLFLNYF